MHIRMVLDVDVDLLTWSREQGTDNTAAAVVQDVRSYFTTHILCAPAVTDGACDVRVTAAPQRAPRRVTVTRDKP